MTGQRRVFVGIFLIVLSHVWGQEHHRCPPEMLSEGWIYEYGEKCYQIILREKTWEAANTFCRNHGGTLANTDTSAKHYWLVNKLTSGALGSAFQQNGFWIGLHDRTVEGRFYWTAQPGQQESVLSSFQNWYPGEPNDITGQDCVYMRRQYNWRWVDVGCNGGIGRYYMFACQYDYLPETTTTSTTTTSTTTTPTTTTPTTTTPTTTMPPTTTPKRLSTLAVTTTTQMPTIPITIPTTPSTIPTKPSTTGSIRSTSHAMTSTTPITTTELVPIDLLETPVAEAPPQTDDLTNGGISAGTGASKQNKQGEHAVDTGQTNKIVIGLMVMLVIAIIVIVLLVLRRRRRRNEEKSEPVFSLNNPMYTGDVCTNDLGSHDPDDNEYATCHIQSNGNVYVGFSNGGRGTGISRSNLNVIEDDPHLHFANELTLNDKGDKVLASAVSVDEENAANEGAAALQEEDKLKSGKFLDDYGTYTEDGYMAPKHLYADISDILPPRYQDEVYDADHYAVPQTLSISKAEGHYDIPVNRFSNPPDKFSASPPNSPQSPTSSSQSPLGSPLSSHSQEPSSPCYNSPRSTALLEDNSHYDKPRVVRADGTLAEIDEYEANL